MESSQLPSVDSISTSAVNSRAFIPSEDGEVLSGGNDLPTMDMKEEKPKEKSKEKNKSSKKKRKREDNEEEDQKEVEVKEAPKRIKSFSVVRCGCCDVRWFVGEKVLKEPLGHSFPHMPKVVVCEVSQRWYHVDQGKLTENVPSVDTIAFSHVSTQTVPMEVDVKETPKKDSPKKASSSSSTSSSSRPPRKRSAKPLTPTSFPAIHVHLYKKRVMETEIAKLKAVLGFSLSDHGVSALLKTLTQEQRDLAQSEVLLDASEQEQLLSLGPQWHGFYLKAWFAERGVPLGRIIEEAGQKVDNVWKFEENSAEDLETRSQGKVLFLGINCRKRGPDNKVPKKSTWAPDGKEIVEDKVEKKEEKVDKKAEKTEKKVEKKATTVPAPSIPPSDLAPMEEDDDVDEERNVTIPSPPVSLPPKVTVSPSKKTVTPQKPIRTASMALDEQVSNSRPSFSWQQQE